MTIPIYRHNLDHDDWEVASAYDSDDCDSMGRSACDESVHSSGSPDDPALHLQGHIYDGSRPLVRYSVPQSQHQNYSPAPFACPRWDAHHASGIQSSFIVPPPGVIFPSKDWTPPPQDTYWPSTPGQIASSDAVLVEPPPPSSLLLARSSPLHASSQLIRLPSSPATTTIAHGHAPHAVSSTGTGSNANTHASRMMLSPPRHDVALAIPPRLAEAGCQAHSGMGTNAPRRSERDVLSSSSSPPSSSRYTPGPSHALVRRRPPSSEEMTVADRRRGGPSYGPGDRTDLSKREYEREDGAYGFCAGAGRMRTAGLSTRERRPSIWRRFVRRFAPSHASVGQT